MAKLSTPLDRIARMSTKELMLDAQRIRSVRLELVQKLAALDQPPEAKAPSILDAPNVGLIDGGLAG